MHQEKNYKVCLNVKSNGATCKEFKLNYYVQFLQITLFTFKGHNLFILSSILTFFVPLDVPSGELKNIFEALEAIEQRTKICKSYS
jgi:hypothetical protein